MVSTLASETDTNGLTKFAAASSLSRLSYFLGQRLGQRDFQDEQRYHLLLQRLMQREAFGLGTVAGLGVEGNDQLPLGVVVSAGLAIDPDGRELILEKDAVIDVANKPLTPAGNTFSETVPANLAGEIQDVFGASFLGPSGEETIELDALVEALLEVGLVTPAEKADYDGGDATAIGELLGKIPQSPLPAVAPGQLLREVLFSALVGTTFIGLRYREVGAEPAPAVLDGACCGPTTCRPARTQEGVFIVTSPQAFPELLDPYQEIKLCLDTMFFGEIDSGGGESADYVDCKRALCECLLKQWKGLPKLANPCAAEDLPTVCLAQVLWDRYPTDEPTQILAVDNCGCRPLAPGAPAVRALIESLTACATPTNLLPRIASIIPAEGAVFTQDQTGVAFNLKATPDALLEASGGNLQNIWQIRFYPADGGDVEIYIGSSFQGRGLTVELIGGDIALKVAAGAELLEGTYVWGFPNVDTTPFEKLQEDVTDKQLDGEPNPPDAVPSGNGAPGGAFEARFVVVASAGGGE